MKVHAEKKFKCSKCGFGFGMEKDKRRHEEHCGKKFTCTSCQCTYVSVEALLTHCYRTQHPVPDEHVKSNRYIVSEWASDCCLTLNEQFFSYIMARTSYIDWNDDNGCFVLDLHVLLYLDLHSVSTLKQQSVGRRVTPQIILWLSQPVFSLSI